MAIESRDSVEAARTSLAQARSTLIQQLYTFEKAEAALREAKRSLTGTDLAPFETALASAVAALTSARQSESQARVTLQNALANWLQTDATDPLQSAEEDISRLPTTAPIVLFPVRVETRFLDNRLKVRVFPDEIFLDTHEVALTEEEKEAAELYYKTLNQKDNEPELWRDLVARFGAERSAYILRQMLPVFGDPGPTSSFSSSSSTCGGTIFGGNDEDLFFPPVQLRSSAWTRPGEAVLPDRWVVITYRGNGKRYTLGNRIIEPLAMTPDPKSEGEESQSEIIETTQGGYRIDDDLRWTVDFQRAVAVGMGIEVTLEGDDGVAGFDRVIVVGVKTSMSELDTSRMFEKLIDAHHYTRGVALVRQGSPTNNTDTQVSPFPPVDDAGRISYAVERQPAPLDREFSHHCLPRVSDGYKIARMLGVPSGVFANVDRALQQEVERGHHMNQALWHGTLGYFMRHMMDAATPGQAPIFTASRITQAEAFFTQHVLARGPAPAFRVGGTPYGVLPIASLAEWEHDPSNPVGGHEEVERTLREPLERLLAIWLDGTSAIPRVQLDSANVDYALARVLANYANAREFWLRDGSTFELTFWQFFIQSWDPRPLLEWLLTQTRATLGRLGLSDVLPAVGTTLWSPNVDVYTRAAVADVLSETAQLPVNYIAALRNAGGVTNAGAQAINENTYLPVDAPSALFRTMLRRSALTLFSNIASSLTTTKWVEFGLFGIVEVPIQTIIPSVYDLDSSDSLRPLATRFYDALAALTPVPSAELDRLFRATMDACSRRIDAWITAFAHRRLVELRTTQENLVLATVGDFMGGYGWLENVRPVQRTTEPVVPGSSRLAEIQPGNGGFVHTPSMVHATAAALLRNAHMSSTSDNASTFAVDLSSRRVRQGRELFAGVRNGQPVGALLGYHLERNLRDNYPGATGLDAMRFALRKKYPLVANKSGEDPGEPAESIAARNVVDGEALLTDHLNNQLDLSGDPALPSPGQANYTIFINELDKLAERYDAAADLLTAEAAFQLARGNIEAASPTMANVVEGRNPPDSVIARTARTGVAISHSVAMVFHGDESDDLPAWPAPTPRALAEPTLNAWLAQLLGEPSQIAATVSYLDENGDVINTSGGQPNAPVTLDELGLHPLDLLAIAEVIAQANQGAMLDRRIVSVAVNDSNRGPASVPASIRVDYVSNGGGIVRLIEVLNTAQSVLSAARPLKPSDLVPPAEVDQAQEETDEEPPSQAALDFYQRSVNAKTTFIATQTLLSDAITSGTGLRDALTAAAAFLPLSAFPDPVVDDADLVDGAPAILEQLDARALALPAEFTTPGDRTASELAENGLARLEAVFGEAFVAMPEFEPPRPQEIDLSLAARTTLLNNDDAAPDRYLQQMMRARPRLGRYRKLNLYARTAGVSRANVDVLQLPHVPGDRWLGLPFETRPEESRAAMLLLNYEQGLEATVPWKGLVIDDWNEVIPNEVEETGFALHYNSPQAQAPQAILVATPSKQGPDWTFSELLASLEQTMSLMKARAIESEYVDYSQVFPPMVIGKNPNIENSVTTDLGGALARAIREALGG